MNAGAGSFLTNAGSSSLFLTRQKLAFASLAGRQTWQGKPGAAAQTPRTASHQLARLGFQIAVDLPRKPSRSE
jgi:hypothetical protein